MSETTRLTADKIEQLFWLKENQNKSRELLNVELINILAEYRKQCKITGYKLAMTIVLDKVSYLKDDVPIQY